MGKARKDRRERERALARAVKPEVSESRRLQREHVRMIRTKEGVKPVAINIGVKPVGPVAVSKSEVPVRKVVVRPRVRSAPFVKLKPLPDWKRIFSPSTETDLDRQNKLDKEMDEEGIELLDGERVVLISRVIPPSQPMGTIASVNLKDYVTGEIINVPLEWCMSNSSLIEGLRDLEGSNKRVIVGYGDDPGDEVLPLFRTPYFRSFAKTPPNIPFKQNFYEIKYVGDNIVVSDGKDKMMFKSMEDFDKAEAEAGKFGRDVFGNRMTPQTFLGEFNKKRRKKFFDVIIHQDYESKEGEASRPFIKGTATEEQIEKAKKRAIRIDKNAFGEKKVYVFDDNTALELD